ncbi:hypothetical protein F5Y16DRAFT_395320 [Xylariaceae sp. FL0255]|nr:hypothetical protein F5Y16DRAFT_395320 [Xylariaceae sp. FL0255]
MPQPRLDERMIVDVDPKSHSVEGHTKQCYLNFNGQRIWGIAGCHPNTTRLAEALHSADSRFELVIWDKHHSVEGHIATITVRRGDHVFLDKMSTHNNMTGLRDAIRQALNDADGPI